MYNKMKPILIIIAAIFIIVFTAIFIISLFNKNEPKSNNLFKWIKNVFDSLWGIG